MLFYIVGAARKTLRMYGQALTQLSPETELFRQIMVKFRFFLKYRLLVVAYYFCRTILLALRHSLRNVPLWPQLLVSEIVDVVFCLLLFTLLMPRRSPTIYSNANMNDVLEREDFVRFAPILV